MPASDRWRSPSQEGSVSRSEQRQRTELVAVRLTPAEKRQLEAAAKASPLSLAGFIRQAALAQIPIVVGQ